MSARLLERLDRVIQTADRQWRARCPAHDGRSRTLSVREMDDGRTLIHCFAGCEPMNVLAAAGLQIQDLFPERPFDHQPRRRTTGMPPREALALVNHECVVALLVLSDVITARTFDDEQLRRLSLCVERISAARDLSCPARPAKEAVNA